MANQTKKNSKTPEDAIRLHQKLAQGKPLPPMKAESAFSKSKKK